MIALSIILTSLSSLSTRKCFGEPNTTTNTDNVSLPDLCWGDGGHNSWGGQSGIGHGRSLAQQPTEKLISLAFRGATLSVPSGNFRMPWALQLASFFDMGLSAATTEEARPQTLASVETSVRLEVRVYSLYDILCSLGLRPFV